MGLRTRYLITKVSSKQWKGQSYSKVHEKDHPISMAWTVPRREQVGPSATAIPKHPITQRRTRSSPKIVWMTNTRHPTSPWQCSTSMAEEQAHTTMENVVKSYNSKARPLPKITIGSRVALQNPETKRWDIYGTVTDITPHRRYFIRTQSGRLLVRNRRFLHCRIPPSIPT